ncbi:uncharacterized protein LOC128309307, partial [Anopheles moucheti]|uniref:uncharacterized protein LOC128309307 n=1 Tax=Anopheles moucheti TaxID=186751 RepID=UPI0022F0BAA4
MEHGDDTVQDGQQTSQRVDTVFPSEEQTAERESVVATNATPSCSARSPVAVQESSQSEGILGHRGEQTVQTPWGYFPVRHRDAIALDATPEAARPSPYHTNTHAQNGHTQPEGLRRVTDGASNSAMATAHRSATHEGFMTPNREHRRKQLELERLRIELQQRKIELRARELEFSKGECEIARESQCELEKASAWLLHRENGGSLDAAERRVDIGTEHFRCEDNPTVATSKYAPTPTWPANETARRDAEFREWQSAMEDLMSRDPRRINGTTHRPGHDFGHSTLAQPHATDHDTSAAAHGHDFEHSTSTHTHGNRYGHTAQPHGLDHGYYTFIPPRGLGQANSTFAQPRTSAPATYPHNVFVDGHAGTLGSLGSTFLSQSQIAARKASGRELPTFSGSAEQWPLFISSYEHSTAICGYSDYENLLRLQKALKGAALEAVSSLLLLPSGLKEAIDVLKLRFGRPEVIVENLMEKVRRMPAPRADRLDTLVEFGFAVRNLCATIQASGLPEYTCNVILLKELIVKLPSATCIEWARHQQQLPSVTLSDFGRWIGELAAALSRVVPVKSERFERSGSGDSDRRSSVKPVRPDQRQPTTARLNMHAATTSGKYPHTNVSKCSACQGECAALDTCQRFQTMTVAERKEHIRDKKLCRKCLKYHKGWCHLKTVCGSNGCEAMHHRLLHGSLGMTNTTEKHCLTHSGSNDRTLFRYVPVTMYGKDGRTVRTYAFLDEGSSSTFIDHSLMDELGLIGTSRPLCLKWTGDTTREEKASVQLAVQISGAYEGAPVHELTKVHTVSNLALPAQTIDGKQLQSAYPHLKGLPFTSYVDAVPRVLIGVDNCRLGKPLKCTEGRVNEPIASKTRLGWMIYGPCPIATASVTGGHRSFHICSCEGNVDGVLTSEVKAFFSLDSLGITKPSRLLKSKDDERALVILNRETKLQGDRFETGLLWRYDDVRLPCNKAATMKRYELLKRKMSKDPELAAAVNQKMRDYIQKGYIRRLSASEAEDKRPNDWFLPIFPVTNPNKPGKIRMVFDAAAKVSGVSLNSFLLAGPDLLAGLLSVLFKFREFRVAVVGDIREMFHQVMMRTEDQRSQMILWDGDDPNGDPAVYVVTVMTFGAACSPSSAQFVKNRNAERFEEEFPRAAKCIKDEHYVDDMLVNVETEEEAVCLAKEVRDVHQKGGFEIRNWVSNSLDVVRQLQTQAEHQKSIDVGYGLATEKVLGMWWDTASDTFTFQLSTQFTEKLQAGKSCTTKRNLLRILMSIYDPMGLLGMFLMYLKVLLQEIWRSGIGWDQELHDQPAEKWLIWQRVLPDVQKVRVRRCYRAVTSIRAGVELHVFCDASECGMAAVAYLRYEEDGVVECSLVGSKTRVAPMRFVSIPRLELQAAVIGARLAATIVNSHRLNISRTVFWTDSRNVLSWLRSDHRRYNQFVAFRVGELLETTEVEQWRWIPTKMNVADDGTKWTKTPDLSPTSRWFNGPSFLWGSESLWPGSETTSPDTPEELRPNVLHHTVQEPLINFHRFSKWRRLLRAVAYVVRFVTNVRRAIRKDVILGEPLTQEELTWAEQIIITQIQADVYACEIRSLKKDPSQLQPWKSRVEKNSPLYKISPVLDDHGIIRMRGRLAGTLSVSETLQQPIILPRKHRGTELLILSYHERYRHCNHRTVVSELRARYYIPQVLGEYNRVRKSCQRCKIDGATPEPPSMGNVPSQRVAVGQRAFSFTGVDYFGPLLVAVGRRVEKRWGVIFTCLTCRAIHLEMAHSLTTASCIMAIRRFIARRGKPIEIISDRGTNFVGSARELEEALQTVDVNAMMDEFVGPEMKWSFNLPAAPHFGGCWERLVRSVKKVLGQFELPRKPTDEVLMSTLTEIEFIINSRPLTYVPLDDEMDTPITPNHLLLGSSNGCKPPAVFDDSGIAAKSAWRAAQRNADVFWRRWVSEYLPTLTRRSKWFVSVRPIQVGDVVIVVDNCLPRNSWPKGRVIDVVRAQDGQ